MIIWQPLRAGADHWALLGKGHTSDNLLKLLRDSFANPWPNPENILTNISIFFERLLGKSWEKTWTNILNLTKHLEFESKAAGPSRAGARGPTTHSPSPLVLLGGGGPAPAQTFANILSKNTCLCKWLQILWTSVNNVHWPHWAHICVFPANISTNICV